MTMRSPAGMSVRTRALAGCAAVLTSAAVMAEEGGSGHYLPGSMASFLDGVPATEVFIARANFIYYDGSVSASEPLPIAGLKTVGAEASSPAFGLSLLWRPSWGSLTEHLSYAMSATIPVLETNVSANVVGAGPGGGTASVYRSTNTSGLGDIVLMPLMLNYTFTPDFSINFRVAGYAPTGNYVDGRLANTGKNYWTIEPTVGFMYRGQQNGREASVFLGSDFNQENSATQYKSGTQMHLDSTFAQHFPLIGGLAGGGLSVFYYKQVSPDSGSGASFGSFEAKTWGLGPALSFIGKTAGQSTMYELKWLHEFDTNRRPEGNTIWFKALVKF